MTLELYSLSYQTTVTRHFDFNLNVQRKKSETAAQTMDLRSIVGSNLSSEVSAGAIRDTG
jgi:hypothetical protein